MLSGLSIRYWAHVFSFLVSLTPYSHLLFPGSLLSYSFSIWFPGGRMSWVYISPISISHELTSHNTGSIFDSSQPCFVATARHPYSLWSNCLKFWLIPSQTRWGSTLFLDRLFCFLHIISGCPPPSSHSIFLAADLPPSLNLILCENIWYWGSPNI